MIDGAHDVQSLFEARSTTEPAELSAEVSLPHVERYVFVGRYVGAGTIHGVIWAPWVDPESAFDNFQVSSAPGRP